MLQCFVGDGCWLRWFRRGLAYACPGGWEGFEVALRAVLGQQISLKFATQLASRVVSGIGTLVTDRVDTPGLTHAFPRPERFNIKRCPALGFLRPALRRLLVLRLH